MLSQEFPTGPCPKPRATTCGPDGKNDVGANGRRSQLRTVSLGVHLFAAALLSAACSQLPDSGPNHYVVDRKASQALTQDRRAVSIGYVLVDVNTSVLDAMVDFGPESFFRTFGMGRGPAPQLRLGTGDVLSVSIFESSAKGLFSSANVSDRPGSYITLPPQTVDSKGRISVPYAGRIRAAGRTIEQVQRDIEAGLAKRAIEPQVVIELRKQTATNVAVFGDAARRTFQEGIKPGGERILDVIAKAGLRYPGHEVFVTLNRGGRRETVFFPRILESANENIYVRPGDVVYLYRQPQTYIAVGALGNIRQTQDLTGRFTFDSPRLSIAEAIAGAGGLLDERANPRHVYLFRFEQRGVLQRLGMDLSHFDPEQKAIPTVYRVNYRDPSVFFIADRFSMRDRDIIYVSNADSVEADKFFSYVRLITGTVAGVSADALVTRNSIRALRN